MFDRDHYLPSFLSEMSFYLKQIRQHTELLEADHPAAQQNSTRQLARLHHAINGLGGTVELSDIAQLALVGEHAWDALTLSPFPPPQAMHTILVQTIDYLEDRVRLIEATKKFSDATEMDMQVMTTICQRYFTAVPHIDEEASSFMMAQDEQSNGVIMLEPLEQQSGDDLFAYLPPEYHDFARSFLATDLSDTPDHIATTIDETIDSIPDVSTAPLPDESAVFMRDALSRYVVELSDDLALLDSLINGTQDIPLTRDDLLKIATIAHKIKGTALTLHYETIGRTANLMLDTATRVQRHEYASTVATAGWFRYALRTLGMLRDRLGTPENVTDDSALIVELTKRRDAILEAAEPLLLPEEPPESQPATVPLPALTAMAHIDLQRVAQVLDHVNHLYAPRLKYHRWHTALATDVADMGMVITRLADLADRLRTERSALASVDSTGNGSHHRPTVAHVSTMPNFIRAIIDRSGSEQPVTDRFSDYDILLAMFNESIADLQNIAARLQTISTQLDITNALYDQHHEQLERSALGLRVEAVGSFLPRLRRAARQTMEIEEKLVRLVESGNQIEIDRDIGDVIIPQLEQLVRNAIVHGIETPDERQAAGKPREGRITLNFTVRQDDIVITVEDDGRGLNPHYLIIQAQANRNLAGQMQDPAKLRALSDAEALELIFEPGISTYQDSTSLSAGAGLGLYGVRKAIASLQGTITVASTEGQGTTFTIALPVTLKVIHALTVSVAMQEFAIPLPDIITTTLIDPAMIVTDSEGQHLLQLTAAEGTTEMLPLVSLPDLPGFAEPSLAGNKALIIADDKGKRYAIRVDQFGMAQDFALRPVPYYLRERFITGAAIAPTGSLILLLDLPGMLHAYGQQMIPSQSAPAPGYANDVLIIDDSPSIRHSVATVLSRAGYAVRMARDGIEAIDEITRLKPRLVILDVEMPRLNGYDLLLVLREHTPFQTIRVIMLTSRAGEAHRAYALQQGAQDYLVKPCADDLLLDAVQRNW